MRIAFIVLLIGMLMMTGACTRIGAIEPGSSAPDISLKDINGAEVKLSDFKGKVIILDFFATWCPPCREEIPHFIALQNEYAEKGFTMVGVALARPDEAKSFAERVGINYPTLIDDEVASSTYGPIRSIPTTFVIDKDFKIARVFIGYRDKSTFKKAIEDLLK